MLDNLLRPLSRLLLLTGMAACGQLPEPSTEQPRLSAWIAERYEAQLRGAEIVKINAYSSKFEEPVYVEMRDNVPIYFPYVGNSKLVVFVVELRQGRPIVKHDGTIGDDLTQITGAMAPVIEDAIRRARVHNQMRDLERRAG